MRLDHSSSKEDVQESAPLDTSVIILVVNARLVIIMPLVLNVSLHAQMVLTPIKDYHNVLLVLQVV